MSQTLNALLKLRELILTGKLSGGSRVSEQSLVEQFGVSRTPIRAALQRLEQEGLCKPAALNGYEISSFAVEEVLDAIEVRATLEGMAARSAAERGIRRVDVAEFEECLTKLDQVVRVRDFSVNDLSDYVRLNERFHALIVSHAGNQVLKRSLDNVLALPFASPSAFVGAQSELPDHHEVLQVGQSQHRAIFEAIERGDAAQAESVAREHARIAKRNLKMALNDQTLLERIPGWTLIRSGDANSYAP